MTFNWSLQNQTSLKDTTFSPNIHNLVSRKIIVIDVAILFKPNEIAYFLYKKDASFLDQR